MNSTPFDHVKVVILGARPVSRARQAHGLSFSVPQGIAPPPSLVNILRKLSKIWGLSHPNMVAYKAGLNQGVLLLNSVLTVEERKAASHKGKGWSNLQILLSTP